MRYRKLPSNGRKKVKLFLISSAMRKPWQPITRPFALIPTMLAPTTTKGLPSNTWKRNKRHSKQTIELDNLVIMARNQVKKNERIVAYSMHERVYTRSRARGNDA